MTEDKPPFSAVLLMLVIGLLWLAVAVGIVVRALEAWG